MHDSKEAILTAEESSGQGIRAAWIGLAGMAVTAVLQIVIVAVSGSVGLLADTLHNVGHAITTIPLIIAFRIGQRAATNRYTFGYRRAEDLAGLSISLVIAVSAGVIIWESFWAFLDPPELTNLAWVLAAGVVGAVGNELVAVYRIRVGRRIGSAALIAEGQHARADGLTSIAVVIGVLGVWLGFPRADAVIGFVIAAAILWIMVKSLRITLHRLMDGVEPGIVERMTEVASTVPDVVGVDRLRVRWAGHRLEAIAEISVDGSADILQGHRIAEELEHELLHRIPHLEQVVIHLHPLERGKHPDDLHLLSGHHAGAEARRVYQQQLAAADPMGLDDEPPLGGNDSLVEQLELEKPK